MSTFGSLIKSFLSQARKRENVLEVSETLISRLDFGESLLQYARSLAGVGIPESYFNNKESPKEN